MADEIFDIFDANNVKTGQLGRSEVHTQGFYHRSVHVLVFNQAQELLLQQRALNKDICPGLWDLSVGEHCAPNEAAHATAQRGLQEELGITRTNLPTLHVWRPWRTQHLYLPKLEVEDNEFVCTFHCQYNGPITLDPVELNAVEFQSLSWLKSVLSSQPQRFTPWLQQEANYWFSHPTPPL